MYNIYYYIIAGLKQCRKIIPSAFSPWIVCHHSQNHSGKSKLSIHSSQMREWRPQDVEGLAQSDPEN